MNDEARGPRGPRFRARSRAAAAIRVGSAVAYGYPHRRRRGHGRADLCGARSRHQQLPAPGRALRPATVSASSTRFPASSGSARVFRHPAASARRRSCGAVEALAICRDKMKNRGVTRARLIATEACRAAENGDEFRARIAEEVGLELEIIDRETEALLAATGCTPLIDPDARRRDPVRHRRRLVRTGAARPLDADARGPPLPEIEAWVSLPLGVVTLAERHGGHAVTREIYEAMVDEVAVACRSLRRRATATTASTASTCSAPPAR